MFCFFIKTEVSYSFSRVWNAKCNKSAQKLNKLIGCIIEYVMYSGLSESFEVEGQSKRPVQGYFI